MSVWIDLMGWVGGVMIAVAYSLVSTRRVAPDSAAFQGLNMLGALLLGTACVQQGSLPSAFINAVWVVVGVKALLAKVTPPAPPATSVDLQLVVRRSRSTSTLGVPAGRRPCSTEHQPRASPPAANVTSGPEFGAGSHVKWLGVREG